MKEIKKEHGFTLIEMLIVLLIISVLVLIAIPNATKHSKSIDEKGCEAYIKMLQSQVEAFKIDTHAYPTSLVELKEEGYLKGDPQCPDGTELKIDAGEVMHASG